ncbi:HAMP domain-containing histidine kinase [Nocardioides anomalus]|uniref:histidine kinase n=1 Tax=Nocardioides anomalus TaxID=2712223 RepID=A0A6G6W905_9ACTN|nr:HAMP domain-containing sensor histidine kinase [Nocardioides anomalus]QIG41585.1 HAMP domain-containing histidine kinase [Nocardioides anomalus]
MRTLTARLVVTAVALVLVVSVLIGVAATLAIQNRLTRQVDNQLTQIVERPGPGPGGLGNAQPGTLQAGFPDGSGDGLGYRSGYGPDRTELDDDALQALADVPTDGEIHALDVPGLGGYRARAAAGSVRGEPGTVVVALPTEEVSEAVHSLIGYEAVLVALGTVLAAGGGLLLVRRQLRPLREVAATADRVSELDLTEGEIELHERVPAHLTDERTEVGQVGAALNTLLAHVETSLAERHRSEQQVRQFVADASHELRTPLATIAGYTELARRRGDDQDTVRTALGKVEEESGRMTSLVEDLLLLARLDAGRPLAAEPVDLTHLLLEAVSDARVVAPDHRWRLELPDEPVEVTGDEQRLHQVVTNLLTNARKHTPAGTTVTVTGRPDGFDVHDDGPGFPPDFVDQAFERFARVDEARERSGGAGLGLSLVEAIVRSHGGTVSLHSAPGGTTIAVRLRP